MSERNFMSLLKAKWDEGKFVCVGLDSDLEKVAEARGGALHPAETIWLFNADIVEATKDLVCAYKPNIAFYEEHGREAFDALDSTIKSIRQIAPDVPVILDYKRGDIGNTNTGYIREAFNLLDVDAVTINPYLGRQAMQPFLDMANKGIIVLCRTSNPGAGEFQDLTVEMVDEVYDELVGSNSLPENQLAKDTPSWPLYQQVAYNVSRHWDHNDNCALVVGATAPDELQQVRRIVGDMPILIPGVGFQQKEIPLKEQVRLVVTNGKDSDGQGMIINSSRGIIFASSGDDFAEAARHETQYLHDLITGALA